MYQLAVFDLDGTLLNSLEDLACACNYALKQCNFNTHETEAYKKFLGNGVYKLIECALPAERRDEETIIKVKKIFDAYYDAHNADYTRPYEGIVEMLQTLKENGVQTAVVSNKPHAFAKQLVNTIFKENIAITYGQREGVQTKPDPTTVLEVIAYFNKEKDQCIYIGDSDVDIYTAKNAQIQSIGVLWGFRTEEELREAGADFIVTDVKQLLKYILN